MTGYWQASLKDMIDVRGEAVMQNELSRFSCPLNPDIEYFIKTKAIEFDKMGFAATHLVYHSYRGTPVLVGYYALANKSVSIKGSTLNRRWRSRLNRFARYDYDAKQYSISLPLIGQLGKNFENENNRLITGDQLLAFACNKVREAQRIMGGKMVYLECEDKLELIEFYERNGFYIFGHRNLDNDEIGHDSNRYLVQLIKYFSNKE
ncbi:MAG: N-acetyltransferase [Clostridia bacterium]|nr:N-acetyltransferase [Clostridia bacterium]